MNVRKISKLILAVSFGVLILATCFPAQAALDADKPVLVLTPPNASLQIQAGDTSQKTELRVKNGGGGVLNFQAKTGMPWIRLSPESGSSWGEEIPVSIEISGKDLQPGQFVGMVTIEDSNATNSPQTFRVNLSVMPASAGPRGLTLSLEEVKFGASGAASQQALRITNPGFEKVNYAVRPTEPWVTVMPQSGVIDPSGMAIVTIGSDSAQRSEGAAKAATVLVTDEKSGSEYKVSVVYEGEDKKEEKPELKVSVPNLEFSGAQGKEIPPQGFDIQNAGKAPLQFKIETGADWLSAQPATGSLDAGKASRISVVCDPSRLKPGKKEAKVKVTADGALNSPQQVKVAAVIEKQPSGKKSSSKVPAADPTSGIVPLAGGLWEKRIEGTDKSQYGKGIVPGPLKGLVLPVGDTDKQYWTETRIGSTSDGNYDSVELMYSRELHLMDQAPSSPPAFRKTVWQMHVHMDLFSPRTQWGGYPEREYVSTTKSWSSQEQHGAVPQRGVDGADKSYVTQRINKQYGSEKNGESWHFIVMKDGVVFTLEASTYSDTVKHFGVEPNFYPWAEQLVKEISAKKWQSIFIKDNPKYDKLPDFIKPLVINRGILNPDGITLRQVATSDWASLTLYYYTNHYDEGGVYRLSPHPTVTFYVPYDKGEEIAKRVTQIPAPDEHSDYSKASFGDGGYKKASKKYPTDVEYLVRVGSGTVHVSLTSGRTIMNPPTDFLEELIDKVRAVDYDAVAAYTGSPEAAEEYVEEELSEEVFEEAPEEELPENFWDPGYDPSIGGIRVALPETPGQPAIDPATYQPQPGDKSTNGLVWSGTYGDWVRSEVYDFEDEQKRLGRVWRGDRRGWETPSETKERNEDLKKFIDGNAGADAAEREKLKQLTDAITEARNNLKKLREDAKKRAELQAKLDRLEKESEQAMRDSRWYSSAVMDETSKLIAREVATGTTADGKTSFKAMGLRVIAGVVSGGSSEVVYAAADGMYRVYDNLLEGNSPVAAVAKAVAGMAAEEAFGKALGGVASWAGKKAAQFGRKLMGEAAEQGAANLPKKLAAKKVAVEEALKDTKAMKETAATRQKYKVSSAEDVDLLVQKGRVDTAQAAALKKALADEAEQTRKILELYKKNGMKDLSELERAGHLGTNQAKKLNEVVSREVNDSIEKGVKKNMARFEEKTGVKIKEVMVGDSGSSAGRKARSIKTDADRTVVVEFDEASLKAYADANHGGNVAEAYDKLSKKFAKNQDTMVGVELRGKGVTRQNVDYKTYDRFGKPGLDDSYPGTFVKTVQATKGKTTVYKAGADGEVKVVKTSGQTIVDQEAMINQKISGTAVPDAPKIDTSESGALMAQQKQALAKEGVTAEKAAKALERADKALALEKAGKALEILKDGGKVADIPGGARIDPDLLAKAQKIRDNPQQVKEILGGQSEEAFVKELEGAVAGASGS